MNNIIGKPARGTDFYKRTREVKQISQSLSGGNNIQITAPRRVGKTSILWYLLDNDIEKRIYVYVDTESIETEQDFFKKLLTEIIRCEKIAALTKLKKSFKDGSNRFLKNIKSIKVMGTGIDLHHETEAANYYDELINFLIGYSGVEEKELVILVDEFPQTIENIKKKEEQSAVNFLQKNRELRLQPDFNGKVKFIYTGSIGLNYTVSKLNATATINDLNSIEIGPLNRNEAIDFISTLFKGCNRSIGADATERLLTIVQWYIPFHFQLIIQEAKLQSNDGDEISVQLIEKSVEDIISYKYQNHFDHYHSRLNTQFKGDDFKFVDDVLKYIAQNETINRIQLLDKAKGYNVDGHYRKLIETLIYDGYITQSSDNEFRFNSPILKRWWKKFIY